MVASLIALFIAASFYGSHGCDVNAALPKSNPPVDMSQFTGTWYETVTSIDTISLDHDCIVLKDVKPNAAGFEQHVTFYYDNAPPVSFDLHILHTENGNYKQLLVEKNQVIAQEDDNSGKMDPQAASEDKDTQLQDYALLGHPDHYLAYVRCAPTGWIIWAFTPTKTVTTEQLVYMHNDLLKSGVSASLRLGKCENSH